MKKVIILHQDLEYSEKKLCSALRKSRVNTKLVDVREDLSWIDSSMLVLNRVYASVANRNYGDILLTLKKIKELEDRGVRVINDSNASFYDYSKFDASKIQKSKGILTPETFLVNNLEQMKNIMNSILNYPVILKRNCGGRAVDVKLVKGETHLEQVWSGFENYGGNFILQEFVNSLDDFDYRVTCFNGKVLYCYTRSLLQEDSSFKWLASVSKGSERKIVQIDDELKNFVLKATEAIGADFNSLDIVRTDKGYCVIENNLTPNFSDANSFEKKLSESLLDSLTKSIISSHLKTKVGEK